MRSAPVIKSVLAIQGIAIGLLLLLTPLQSQAQAYVRIVGNAEGFSLPLVLTISNTAPTTIFSTNTSTTKARLLLRSIQNTGTNAFLYLIGSTNVSSTNYHGVVAGGTFMRDGLGSVLNLQHCSWPVSLITETGITTISAVELTQ